MSLGLGIIGAGGIAAVHAEAAVAAGSRPAAFFDIRFDQARALAAKHPPAAAVDSLDGLLARDDVEAVVVAVPNAVHAPAALAALRAGKDVLLEKPMALGLDECDEIIDAERASGRLVQVGFVCRHAPAAVAAAKLVADGSLGRVYHARAVLCRRRGIPGLGRWFTDRAQSGGGVLMDLGVHLLDLVPWLARCGPAARASAACTSTFGEPIGGYAFEEMWGGPPDPSGVFDVEDGATALVRFEGGMTLDLCVTWAADVPRGALRDGVTLFGDRGGCFIDLWGNELIVTAERGGRLADGQAPLAAGVAWDAAWRRQAETFARRVADRTPPEASTGAGRAAQALVDAIYRSSAEGREVEVSSC